MAPPDPLIGALFDGRYKILKRLGAGGMATVYLAEDQELGRRVAIKILNAKYASDEQFVERFKREASSAAGLSHPNIVSVYDRGTAEGTYYIAMEVIEGRSLKELIVARGPSPIPIAINYARQILAALRFAHRNGVVHRDIKPHNVLVDEEGRVKVTDFGIARAGASEMTEVGSIIGTAQYLSPEQARGAPVDTRSDLYSVGIVLYELLTGEAPFSGETPVEIAMKHLSAIPEPPSAKRPQVPPDLDAVVLRALAKHPDDRYASVEEMDADLAAVAKGTEISETTNEAATTVLAGAGLSAPTTISRAPTRIAPPPRATTPTASKSDSDYYYDEPVRRRPIWPWLLALGFVLAALAAGYIGYRQLNANKPIVVPSVQEIRKSLAVRRIVAKGLKPSIRYSASDTIPKGFVINQRPTGGDRVVPGSKVTIWVSTGVATVDVPNVVGRSGADAAQILKDHELEWKTREVLSDKPSGIVVAQSPRAGEKAPRGSTVVINISKGPAQIEVLSVVGEPFAQAASELKALGFLVNREYAPSDQPKGVVIDQAPSAGAMVAKGSPITLTVSQGPQTVTVPDVTGLDVDQATLDLQSDGFNVVVKYEATPNIADDGMVLDQNPPGLTEVVAGSTVRIVVGQYTGDTTTATTP